MKFFLYLVLSVYLTLDFFATFSEWMRSKSNKEYWMRFVDTIVAGGLLLAFIKFVDLLTVGGV